MFRNTVINTTFYFYPIGNTPAVCLTQDLPPEGRADILLLGCGDARNILFTTHSSPGRHLDITCCDIEPAILARNILLFTLLIDNDQNNSSDSIWNIYYHLYLDEVSEALLSSQADKLLASSRTLQDWRDGKYGQTLRFCNHRTLASVNAMWMEYSATHLSPQERSERRQAYEQKMRKAREVRERFLGNGISMSGVRSAAPVGVLALADLASTNAQYWKCGTVNDVANQNQISKHPNPTFASLTDQALTLHYGTDPLLGFHLAPAYVPLGSESHPASLSHQSHAVKGVVQAAQSQFREWTKSFNLSATAGSIFRFISSDAIAFGHTLQKMTGPATRPGSDFYCDNWTFQVLKLDSGDYGSGDALAPTSFDIIDTSNLTDHLGALNVLVATAPLLADKATSALYTEVLVQHEASLKSRVSNILCGVFGIVSLLLGLGVVESWTNATGTADVDEGMVDAVSDITKINSGKETLQSRTRFLWKPLSSLSRSQSLSPVKGCTSSTIKVDAQQLSLLLRKIYGAMFCHEDTMTILASIGNHGLQKLSNPYYNRPGFAALVKYLRTKIDSDWARAIDIFLQGIQQDNSLLSIGSNFFQELLLYLHMFDIHSSAILSKPGSRQINVEIAKHLSSWDLVPTIMCLTIEIPRSKINLLTNIPIGRFGTPSLSCVLQSSRRAPKQWCNIFSAVQMSHGQVRRIGSKDSSDFRIEVDEDTDRWTGKSALIVSFFAPAWMVLQEPNTALIACGLQTTPHAAKTFASILGPELRLFETTLENSNNIHITKHMPGMAEYPNPVDHMASSTPDTTDSRAQHKQIVQANIGADGSKITEIICRIDFISQSTKTKLADKDSLVDVKFITPMLAEVVVGSTLHCKAQFPVPVLATRSRLRIARKSSYVEIIAPVLDPLDVDCPPDFVFPMGILPENNPAETAVPFTWNMPYVHMDNFPVIDCKDTTKLQWLTPHTSLMFSSRERTIRESNMEGPGKDIRVDFKDGLFSLFMHVSGVQGVRAKVFALHKADEGGAHVLLFVSALRLDLASHTVIADTAALPLSNGIMGDKTMQRFLGGLQTSGKMCAINVSNAELRLWKTVMTAWAERCRTWKHKSASCEYLKEGGIPLKTGLEDGNSPLCSCGRGHIPRKFMGDLPVPHLEAVLQKYATRMAISPVFAVPYVEDCFPRDMPKREVHSLSGLSALEGLPRCRKCGSEKKKVDGEAVEPLLTCTRCRVARYCSKECQKQDWKTHKGDCVAL